MGKSFTRALRHLKSNNKTTKLDEKKEMLNEIPTMHTGGVYSKNPPGFRYDPPSPAKRFVPDIDGNWPAGVPGTPGATEYIRPQGYWVNDSDWDEFLVPDLRSDFTETSTTNTDGFIDPQTGTVKTLLPPNSRDFILGPLIDGYTYNHGYDDFTTIGYIQKDTRQIVVLGQISGHWDTTSTLPGGGTANRQWDGTASQFTSYNPKFTLAMAQWFKDKLLANDFTKNFPYFYSGGVPQSPLNPQPPGSPGGMPGGNVPGSGGGGNDPAGGPPSGTPTGGSGGDPDTGSEEPQDDPDQGDAESQGYPWGMDPEELDRMSDDDLADQDPPLIRDPDGDIREMTEDEKNEHDAQVLGLSPEEWNKIAEVFDASLLALDVVAVLGVVFPELGTSIAGSLALANRARQIRRAWQIWSNRNKGGPSNKPKPPKPKPKPDPNPNGDVPNSDRKGKDFNVDKDTGIVRNDKGTPTFEPTFDKNGNIKSYRPVDPKNINRGREGGGHPEYNPGGKYNTKPPVKPGNTGGGGGSQPPRGGGNIGGGGGIQPPRGGGRPPRGGGTKPPRGGSSQPKFTGFDGKPLDPVDPSTIRRPDGKPLDPLPPMGGGSGKNTGKPPKGGFREWWNKGRNERIKNENDASFGNPLDQFTRDPDKADPNTLFGDDRRQRGQDNRAFDTGKKSSPIGRPDRAVLGRDLNPLSPDFGKKVAPERGGPGSGPTPLIRQTVERPIRGIKGAAKKAGASNNLLGKQLTQQQEKDVIRKTRVLEDRLVNNIKSEKDIDGFISKTEKAGEFIQKNEEASNVLDTAIKGARTAREVADQIGQYANTIKVAGTAFGKFLAHNAGVMKATPENPVKINLPKQDAQNVSNTINTYLKDNKVPVAQWSNLPQKHLDGINSLVASGQQTNKSTINNKFRGEGGILRDEYHNTVNNIGRKDAFANHIKIDSKGTPYVSGIDDNYTFTDPQDALGGVPAKLVEITNKSPFTRNREDSPYTYKNSDGTSVSIGNMPSRWNLPAPTGAIVKSSPRARTVRGSGFDNQKEPLPTGAIVPKTSGARVLGNNYEPRGTLLREDKKRILREITKPLTEIKDLPKTQKLEKYRPNFKGKYKAQNTPNVTASKKSDEMVKAKNAAGQTWRTKDKYWGGYQSQERMNVVYDNVGHGDQYWDKIVNENLSKRDVKNRRIQEHLNIIEHEKAMRRLDSTFVSPFRNIEEQETLDAPNDPLYKKVAKRLNTEIDYPKKPSPKGFPDKAPPKLDPNTGMHPKYGQRYKYDKLDPQSAEAMPVQGNPEIDANVQKALDKRAKDRKVKNLTVNTTSEKVDWRETLQKRNVGESKKNFKDLQEQLYTNITTGMKVGQTFKHIPSGQTFTTGGALGGRETLPSTVSIFGDPTPAPGASSYPLQGYAKPMDMMRRKNRENLEDINARLDASQEFAKRVNSDVMMGSRVQLQDIIGDDRVPDEMKDAVKKYKSEMEVYDKKAAQRVKVLNNRIQSNISSVSKFVGKYGVKLGKSYPMGSSRLVIAQGGSKLVVISHSGFNYNDSKEFSVRVFNAKIDPKTGKQLKISKEMGNFGRVDGDGIAQNPFSKPLKNQETIGRIANLGRQIEDKTFSIKDIPPISMPEPPKNLFLTPPQMGGDSVVMPSEVSKPSEDSNVGVGRTETKWALKNGLDPTKDKPSYSNFTYSQIDDSNDLRNAVMDEFSKRMLAAKNNKQAQLKIGKEQMEWERQFKKMMESKPPSNDKNFFSKMFNNIANYGAKLTGNAVSKTVFDTYMNKLDTKTLTSKPENITKLLKNDSQGRIEYSNLQTMVDGVMADVTLASDVAREAALNAEYEKLRTGLSNVKNIVGQLDRTTLKNDGFKIVRNNNGVVTGIKLNKSFDFTGGTDTAGAGSALSGAPAMAYASMKGLNKYFKSADFKMNSRGKIVKGKKVESPTMNVQLDFGIHSSVNKKKKNKLGKEIK